MQYFFRIIDVQTGICIMHKHTIKTQKNFEEALHRITMCLLMKYGLHILKITRCNISNIIELSVNK